DRSGLTRGELLKAAAATSGGLLLAGGASAAQAQPTSLAGMNVVVLLTDQERAIQHFPQDWARENLPGLTRLQDNGLTFERAVTNACMCSPARSTLMTSYLPAQH